MFGASKSHALEPEGLRADCPVGVQLTRFKGLATRSADGAIHSAGSLVALRLLEVTLAARDGRYPLARSEWSTVAAVWRRLEGNPLVFEMAASRVPLIGLAELERRIGEQLDLL